MSEDWVLRWLAMLVLFALSSLAVSVYAGATPAPPSPSGAIFDHPPP